MALINLIDNTLTDKNTYHTYIEVYDVEFFPYKFTTNNILEIGVYKGGSIKLWADYFINANIYGIDINDSPTWIKEYSNRIKLFKQDAYNYESIKSTFIDNNITFDIIIDDGPHTVDSALLFFLHYRQLLNSGGILVLEDIMYDEIITSIMQLYPNENIKCVDMRHRTAHFGFNNTRLLILYKA